MKTKSRSFPIKSWAADDKPREKLLLNGRQSLSDAELSAILIGSGSRDESAVDLCKRILGECNNDLNELGKKSIEDLLLYKGIGEAKALSLIAAMELGRRRRNSEKQERVQIKSSSDAFNLIHQKLQDLPHEEFWIILLNKANKVIKPLKISQGGVSGTVADSKMIFKAAIQDLASAVILVHNHPSDNLTPSTADINLTNKLSEAGKLLDIPVLDHLIIGEQSYYSFADEGML